VFALLACDADKGGVTIYFTAFGGIAVEGAGVTLEPPPPSVAPTIFTVPFLSEHAENVVSESIEIHRIFIIRKFIDFPPAYCLITIHCIYFTQNFNKRCIFI
jgi:hypothetical protein